MNLTSDKITVSEKDKPFVLALVASGITVLSALVAAVGSFLGNQTMKDTGIEVLKFTFPLTTMSWAFYFKAS